MGTRDADLSSLKIDSSKRDPAGGTPGRSRKPLLIGIVAALLVAGAIALFIHGLSAPVKVTAAFAALELPSQTEALLTASGYVVAQRKAEVASKATGRLVYLGVVAGDRVKKGEVLARLEDDDVRAVLSEAKADLALKKAALTNAAWNYKTDKKLFRTGTVSQFTFEGVKAQYKEAKAAVDVAKASVDAAKVALENTIIRAPFDGTVLAKNADVGEIVAPMAASMTSKGAVVTIADMRSLQVEADVAEATIEEVRVGQACIITLDAYPEVHYDGSVAKIIPTANRAKGTVRVKIAFKKYDSRVLPEMSTKVLFLRRTATGTADGNTPVLLIPSTAVTMRHGQQVVFKIVDNRAMETPVSLKKYSESYFEVKSGLQNGDQMVNSPGKVVKNGTKVNVRQKS